MKYKYQLKKGLLKSSNVTYEGESIERQIERIVTQNEPIDETAPLMYTDKTEHVLPQYDIRTDRWEIAQEAQDKVNKSLAASREEKPETPKKEAVETTEEK